MDVFARLPSFTLHLADQHARFGAVLSNTERNRLGGLLELGEFEVIEHRDPLGGFATGIEIRSDVEGLNLADAAEALSRALGVAERATRRERPGGY